MILTFHNTMLPGGQIIVAFQLVEVGTTQSTSWLIHECLIRRTAFHPDPSLPSPRRLCFISFCSLSLSRGRFAMSRPYTERASTAVRESMMPAHSVTSSSQQVREDSTASSSSHRFREMYTYRLALIQATMMVWGVVRRNV